MIIKSILLVSNLIMIVMWLMMVWIGSGQKNIFLIIASSMFVFYHLFLAFENVLKMF